MTGYVRKDTTNNIADGNVINAADLDAEFDGVQDAFNASTGHKHDGTAGEGATINALGPTQDVTISSTLLAPKTTNTVDIGSSSLKFKDLFLAGNGSVGGTLAVTGVATFTAQPIVSSLTASRAVFSDGSKGLVSNAITGTGNVVMSASPTLTGTIAAEALTASSSVTFSGGTANGVAYLNGSKVLTSGSALTFDGTTFKVAKAGGVFGPTNLVYVDVTSSYGGVTLNSASGQNCFFELYQGGTTKVGEFGIDAANSLVNIGGFGSYNTRFYASGSEQMRLTSTGLGIGTSSPNRKLEVGGTSNAFMGFNSTSNRRYTTGSDANGFVVYDDTAGAYRTVIDASGNLGIGTSSPATKLHIANDSTAYSSSPTVQLTGSVKYNSSGSLISVAQIGFAKENATDGNGQGYINFLTRDSGGSVAERMRLDSAGNLGLRVVPSAWASSYRAFQIGDQSALVGYNGNFTWLGTNWVSTASGDKYIANGYAAVYRQNDGSHAWYTAASGTAGNAISFTQAMTLDASGNLGIGTTSIYGKLDARVGTDSQLTVYQQNSAPAITAYTAGGSSKELRVNGFPLTFSGNGGNGAEHARIDSSGNLLVGTTSTGNSNSKSFVANVDNGYIVVNHLNGQGSGSGYASFGYNGGEIGYISQNGTTAVAYNTTSDYRLKNSVAPMTGALAKVALLKPCTYKWNADGSDGEGFIAHELAEVCPHAVTGEKDAVDEDGNPKYQGIDTSFLVATLTAALQEAVAKITALEARLDAANL